MQLKKGRLPKLMFFPNVGNREEHKIIKRHAKKVLEKQFCLSNRKKGFLLSGSLTRVGGAKGRLKCTTEGLPKSR